MRGVDDRWRVLGEMRVLCAAPVRAMALTAKRCAEAPKKIQRSSPGQVCGRRQYKSHHAIRGAFAILRVNLALA